MNADYTDHTGNGRTREEHLAWAKQRSLEYLRNNEIEQAITSILSDLSKHDGTKLIGRMLSNYGLWVAATRDAKEARKFIEGFR